MINRKGALATGMKRINVLKTVLIAVICFGVISSLCFAASETITEENFESYNIVAVNAYTVVTVNYPGYDPLTIAAGQGPVINAPGGTVYTEKSKLFEGNAAENILSYAKISDTEVLALPGGLNNGWRGRYSNPMTKINGEGGADSQIRWSRRRLAVVADGDNKALKMNPAANNYVATWSDYAYENIDFTKPLVWQSDVKIENIAPEGEFVLGIGKGNIAQALPLASYVDYKKNRESTENIISFKSDNKIVIDGKSFEYEYGKYYSVTVVTNESANSFSVSISDKDTNEVIAEQNDITLSAEFADNMNVYYTSKGVKSASTETSALVDNIKVVSVDFEARYSGDSEIRTDGTGFCRIEFSEPYDAETVNNDTVKLYCGEDEVEGTQVVAESETAIKLMLPVLDEGKKYTVKINGVKNALGVSVKTELKIKMPGESFGAELDENSDILADGTGSCIIIFTDKIDADTVNSDTIKLFDGEKELSVSGISILDDFRIKINLPQLEQAKLYKISVSGVKSAEGDSIETDIPFRTARNAEPVQVSNENFESYNLTAVYGEGKLTVNYPGADPTTIAAGQGAIVNAPGGTVYTEKSKQFEGNAAENILSYAKTSDTEVLAVPGGLNNGWRGRYSHPMTITNGQGGADSQIRWSTRRLAVVADGENKALRLNPAKNSYVSTWSDYAYESIDLATPIMWESSVRADRVTSNGSVVMGVSTGSIKTALPLEYPGYLGGREETENIISFTPDNDLLIGGEKAFSYESGQYYNISAVIDATRGKTVCSVVVKDAAGRDILAQKKFELKIKHKGNIGVFYTANTDMNADKETSATVDNIVISKINFDAVLKSANDAALDGGECVIEFSEPFAAETVNNSTIKVLDNNKELDGTAVTAEGEKQVRIKLPSLEPSKYYSIKIDGVENKSGLVSACEVLFRSKDRVSDSSAVFDGSGVTFKLKNNTVQDCTLTVLAVFMKDKKIVNDGVCYRKVTVEGGKINPISIDVPTEIRDADTVMLCYIDDIGHFTAVAPFKKISKK